MKPGMRAMAVLCGLLAAGAAPQFVLAGRQQQSQPAEAAKKPAATEANPKDVESMDAIVAAIYDVISGPAGERDWNRFRSLFIPEGRLTAVRVSKEGKISYAMMSVEDYAGHGARISRNTDSTNRKFREK